MGVILETNQLCKFYGTGENQVKAVNHVNIQIGQGEFVAIVGKSGSGKSTLLHMLGGLDTPTSGSVILSDKDLYSMKEDQLAVFRRRKIGFVFQAFNLVSSINVWENIVLPLGLDGKKVDKAYVNDIITTLGLEHRIHNLPNTLSGGQQQDCDDDHDDQRQHHPQRFVAFLGCHSLTVLPAFRSSPRQGPCRGCPRCPCRRR